MIQNHYAEMLDTADEAGAPLMFLPCLDYEAPGNPKGITVLTGGNHGDVVFHYHYKFHLSSPQMRKAIGNLSHPNAQEYSAPSLHAMQTSIPYCRKQQSFQWRKDDSD
jgi:hypothetical protein